MNVSDTNPPPTRLLKVGELASLAGVLPSTIRYYTKMGILDADGRSPGGYALFDPHRALSRLSRIRELQDKRFRLDEIASILADECNPQTPPQ